MSKNQKKKKGKSGGDRKTPMCKPSTNDRKPEVCGNTKVNENSTNQHWFDRALRVMQIMATIINLGVD